MNKMNNADLSRRTKKKSAFTLLEVMLAVVVVGILVVGGLRYTIVSAEIIQNQKDARVTDAIASRRMALLLNRPYTDYVDDANDLDVADSQDYFFLKEDSVGETFSATATDPGETVSINTATGAIRTRVRLMDTKKPGTTVVTQCVELEVLVKYGPDNKRSLCIKNIQTY